MRSWAFGQIICDNMDTGHQKKKNDKENSLYWPFLIQIVVGHHRNIDIVHLYTVYIKKNDPILSSLQYINERMQDVGM